VLLSEVFMRNLVGQIWLKGEVSYFFLRFYHSIISRDNCEEDISILIPSETLCKCGNVCSTNGVALVFRPMAEGNRVSDYLSHDLKMGAFIRLHLKLTRCIL